MKVLLAGASGAIGRHLVPQLIEAKHEVIGITRTPGSLDGTGAREIVADVLDRGALLGALEGVRADAVVHHATSLKKPPTTRRSMRQTNRLRAEGTSALIAAAHAVGARKLVAASFFGGYGLLDHGREPLTELAPFGEIEASADSVQLALLSLEQQVRAFGGMSLRFGLFYDRTTTAVSPVSRTWDGLLPMLHVSDAAAATVRALAKYKAGAIYNIADDSPMTYRAREAARAAAAGIRQPAQLPDSLIRLVAPFGALLLTRTSISLSTERAAAELGWKPQFPSLLDCLGVDAAADHVVLPKAVPTAAAEAVAEEAVPDPNPEPDSVSKPEPEVVPEPEPEPVVVPEPEPTPDPADPPEPPESADPPESSEPPESADPSDPSESSEPPESADPSDPPESSEPPESGDPFADMDSAIARIGQAHED
jgi:nucleoside-diphosphate-sugar epimerase